MLNQMYEDVPSSIMLDKTILNELVNANVISFSHPRILKTPTVVILLGFFCVIRLGYVKKIQWKIVQRFEC